MIVEITFNLSKIKMVLFENIGSLRKSSYFIFTAYDSNFPMQSGTLSYKSTL